MNKEIELYLHGDESREPKLIRVSLEDTVESLIEKARAAGLLSAIGAEDPHIFLEDVDEEFNAKEKICGCHIRHRQHLHCHRCQRVEVSVTYNGVVKAETFPPSATIKRICKWALKEFDITGADAADKTLRLGDPNGPELTDDVHIGSLVKFPNCKISLFLTVLQAVQG